MPNRQKLVAKLRWRPSLRRSSRANSAQGGEHEVGMMSNQSHWLYELFDTILVDVEARWSRMTTLGSLMLEVWKCHYQNQCNPFHQRLPIERGDREPRKCLILSP